MRVSSSTVVHRHIEMVFAYVSDVKQIAWALQAGEVEYITYRFFGIPIVMKARTAQLREIRQTSEGPLGIGTTFVQVYALPGASSETSFQITEYDPPRAIACTFSGGLVPTGGARVVLAPVSGGTKVTGTLKAEGGCYQLGGLFLAPLAKQQMEISMRRLKERLEAPSELNA